MTCAPDSSTPSEACRRPSRTDDGTFEVTVEADSEEAALLAVWNAMAAAGADEHLVLIEHSKLPDHWRHTSD